MSDGYLISADGGLDLLERMYPQEKYAKPILGCEVYLVNVEGKEIYSVEVYAHGKEFFIPKGFDKWKVEWREIRFDEVEERWFFTLDGAKDKLYEYLKDDEEIVEGEDGFWYAERL